MVLCPYGQQEIDIMASEKNRGDLGHPRFIKFGHDFSFLAPIGKIYVP